MRREGARLLEGQDVEDGSLCLNEQASARQTAAIYVYDHLQLILKERAELFDKTSESTGPRAPETTEN
jgi:hypothetical protein